MHILYFQDIHPDSWNIIDSLYTNQTERVKWHGVPSKVYKVQQGVHQGGVLSIDLYKIYMNGLLAQHRNQNLGMSIGPLYVGNPTCADDMLMLANDHMASQGMTDTTKEHSARNRYTVHPLKTTLATE